MILEDLQELFFRINEDGTKIRQHFGGKSRTWLASCFEGSSYKINKDFVRGLNHYGFELKLVKTKDVVPDVKTNGDFVRHMTDDELVDFLYETSGGSLSKEEYKLWIKGDY